MKKIAGSGSEPISQRHGSADPDPRQNVMDPQHWYYGEKKINDIDVANVVRIPDDNLQRRTIMKGFPIFQIQLPLVHL